MQIQPLDTDLATVGQAIDYCHRMLCESAVFCGHGTDNVWDEAVQLVLSVAQLPLDADQSVLPCGLVETERDAILRHLRARIGDRMPLPYLLGRAWFAGLEFHCDSRAIIPRSPIAELIESEFAPWYSGPAAARLLDVCCGGGCIGLAAAHYMPGLRVDLADIDEDALALADENCRKLELDQRCRTVQSDLFEDLPAASYDIVVSNPPYVDAGELAAMPAEFHAEPKRALGSGSDGLDLTRRLLARVGDFLAPHGLLVLEVGLSWPALERAYPSFPFTWVEFARGGEGVCVMSAQQWQDYRDCWAL